MFVNECLYCGRPEEERMPVEQACYDFLDKLNLEYHRVDHEHAPSIEACHEVEKILGALICKNLLLTNRQQTEVYFLMMPGEKPFKTKLLAKQIGSTRLSFATEEQMESLLGVTPGSLSVLALMNDKEGKVKLVIDEDLLKDEFIGVHPCLNSSTVRLKTADVVNIILPAVSHGFVTVSLPWVIEEE